jgi:hypothetical protein
MTSKLRWVGFVALVGISGAAAYAYADQCTNLSATKSQWSWAQRAVQNCPSVLTFCQPCSDRAPKPWSGHLEKEDLAYLYVQVGDDNYANVAKMVGCPATGVAPFIDHTGHAQ